MNQIEISEVSIEILRSVRQKWRNALETRWTANLWEPCAMCEYVDQICDGDNYYRACNICPLNPDWCNGTYLSALHHHKEDKNSSAWEKRILQFIDYLDSEIARRSK
jgi:hypothetical protein